jgi:DNA-binding MarR family transcriptional regulator
MDSNHIDEMRAFNRFYTSFIGILNKNFLSSKYSLPEIRVLHEIYNNAGLTAKEIIATLNIDKGYLSRLIYLFEKTKILVRKVSQRDGRAFTLHLTPKGIKEFEILNAASENQIKEILSKLTSKECDSLITNMIQIKEILSK